jgi:hypothetical protein
MMLSTILLALDTVDDRVVLAVVLAVVFVVADKTVLVLETSKDVLELTRVVDVLTVVLVASSPPPTSNADAFTLLTIKFDAKMIVGSAIPHHDPICSFGAGLGSQGNGGNAVLDSA